MKIRLRSITVMLGLLAIASMIFTSPAMLSMTTTAYASTSQPDTLRIEEVGNDGNNAEMVKMTVKEGNNPSEREDDFELDPDDNAIFVPKGKNIQVTNDGLRFFRAVATQGDVDKQIPTSAQGVINLNSLDQGFYYLDVVIQDGNTKVAYEAILFIGPRNVQNEDTVNKEVNREDKDVTITKRITNIDKTVICGDNQKFNDKTDKCENIPPPPCKPGQVSTKDKPCTPPKPPTKTPTPTPKTPTPTQPLGPAGEKPTCLTTGNKPGRISSNAKICTPFDGSAPTQIRGPIDVIVPLPVPCIEGQTPERNNCVATTPPGTTFPQCITPGNPPNCVPGPDTKPGATVGTACMTVDGKSGRVAPNGACTQIPQAGPAGTTTPTPQPSPTGPAGESCTLSDGRPGRVTGTQAQGNLGCEPTGVGGATTAPTGPAGSDCALPGGNTGGKVTDTGNGLACIAGTRPPTDTTTQPQVSPSPPPQPEPTDTGEPRPSCTTPDGQPGMMGLSEGKLSCTPIEDQRPTISSLTPELPVPTDPTELANFCADNPQHSACQTPTTPPDQTSQLTPVPEPNVPDTQTETPTETPTPTETTDPDETLFGPTETDPGTAGGTTDMPAQGTPCPTGTVGPGVPDCEPIEPTSPGAVCESGFGTPPNCMTQDEFCAENQGDPRCQPDDGGNGPIPSPSPLPSPGQTLAERDGSCRSFEYWDGDSCEPITAQGSETPLGSGIEPGFGGPLAREGEPIDCSLEENEDLLECGGEQELDCEAQGLVEDDDGNCVAPDDELEDVPADEQFIDPNAEVQQEGSSDQNVDNTGDQEAEQEAEAPSDEEEE